MSRWLDREEEKHGESSLLEGLSRSGAEKRTRVVDEPHLPKSFGHNRRERIAIRDRFYQIRPSEFEMLNTIGRFRLVDGEDLVRGVYGAETDLSRSDTRRNDLDARGAAPLKQIEDERSSEARPNRRGGGFERTAMRMGKEKSRPGGRRGRLLLAFAFGVFFVLKLEDPGVGDVCDLR
jgi:hypothetical protein